MALSNRQPRRILPIASDGWRFIGILLIPTVLFAVFGWWITAGFFLLLTLAVGSFFRDPERAVPRKPGLILSPADGKIIYVDEVEVPVGDGEVRRLRRVGIFLSVFNNHVQRAPTYGAVASVSYHPGKFINALSDKASDENEHNLIWFDTPLGPVGVKQIAGIIARRVLCWVRKGDHMLAGQRIGLIRFGSRAEAFFPLEAVVKAKPGEKACGGLTILAEMPAGAVEDGEA